MPAPPFFTILDTVDSTNNYAMAKVHAGLATHGQAWLAREQTAGRGQRGNSWLSEPGKNIALSLVLEPARFNISHPFCLSALTALACREFFAGYAGDETKIKWPNDLYWRDRKAGGILIENVYQGANWKFAVVGIGININQTTYDTVLRAPVSLKQITGKGYDIIETTGALLQLLMNSLPESGVLQTQKIIGNYNSHLYARNEKVRLKKNNAVFETVVKGVNAGGQLITMDAIERQFDFGEVEWLL
jgi:BirA family transcriptional regulator, biotin operon repressor / biotin---[acetyl-CoA-carboxylase] ligase